MSLPDSTPALPRRLFAPALAGLKTENAALLEALSEKEREAEALRGDVRVARARMDAMDAAGTVGKINEHLERSVEVRERGPCIFASSHARAFHHRVGPRPGRGRSLSSTWYY